MTQPPAGWYPDSYEPEKGLLRFWDGRSWTSHTHLPVAPSRTPEAAPETSRGPDPTQVHAETPTETAAPEAWSPSTSSEIPLSESPETSTFTSATTYSDDADRKITTFNAKRVAHELASEVDHLKGVVVHLERTLAEFGIADVPARNKKVASLREQVSDLTRQIETAESSLQVARAGLVDASDQAVLESAGLFRYDHPAQTSAQLQEQLESLRSQIKSMVKNKSAVHATTGFTFNNSQAKGDKFVRNMSSIMLRAYNAEAENAVKSTKAGNLTAAEMRLSTVKDQIARQGLMIDLQINGSYHALRLKELALASSHLQRLAEERDAERERKAELREQKRVEAEMLAEKARLEKERTHYLNSIAVLEAKGDADGAARLQDKLADVDRAIEDVDYRAANIRAGYVYVISNTGSLGPGTVKIGMTRRLEPMERVKELGDASVPFTFDVHALFFSADAVGVETMLHQTFAEQRLNKVNLRREFFRVTPDQVLEVLKAKDVEVLEFDLHAAAEEFRTSWPDGLPQAQATASN